MSPALRPLHALRALRTPQVGEPVASRHRPSDSEAATTDLEPDPLWDQFVAAVPGGSLCQTSHMARFKAAASGFDSLRYVLREHHATGEVLGGAQVLIKRMPLGLSVGLVPRGPLLQPDHMDRMPELLRGLSRACRRHGVGLVFVQPSPEVDECCDLAGQGLKPSSISMLPTATCVVNLRRSPEQLLGSMHRTTRQKIRQGLQRGLAVRRGDFEDLPRFHELLTTTAERQHFTPAPLEHFQAMWRIFAPHGHIHLLLAESDGKVVSGLLMHSFARTATAKRVGWNGEAKHLHPNHVMHYTAMLAARELGNDAYDLDDLCPQDARTVLRSSGKGPLEVSPVSRYKLLFGPDVMLLPGPMALPPCSVPGRACQALLPLVPKLQGTRAMRLARRVFLGRGYS